MAQDVEQSGAGVWNQRGARERIKGSGNSVVRVSNPLSRCRILV